jgi:hypothetical protein
MKQDDRRAAARNVVINFSVVAADVIHTAIIWNSIGLFQAHLLGSIDKDASLAETSAEFGSKIS